MNSDIRIAVSFKDHRKRKRLRMMVGDRATDYLLDLWISTALNHPSGFLKGMDTLDIALDAGYDGTDPDGFVKALVACGLIEYIEEKSCYHVHDWEQHQAYAIHAEARSVQASKAAIARWGNKDTVATSEQPSDGTNAARMLAASKSDAHSIAESIEPASPHKTEPISEEQPTSSTNAARMLAASKNDAHSIAQSIEPASPSKTEPVSTEQPSDGTNAARMLAASKSDAHSIDFYTSSNAPSPSPSPNPNPNPNPEIQIPPPKINLDTKIARAREKNAEGGEDPDFTTLREFWDEHCRQEGRLTGMAELKRLKISQKWPGINVILLDIRKKIETKVWKPTYAPSLRTYLGEEWYAVDITPTARSRDSPLRPSGVTENNFAVGQQMLKKLGEKFGEKNETTSAT